MVLGLQPYVWRICSRDVCHGNYRIPDYWLCGIKPADGNFHASEHGNTSDLCLNFNSTLSSRRSRIKCNGIRTLIAGIVYSLFLGQVYQQIYCCICSCFYCPSRCCNLGYNHKYRCSLGLICTL